LLLAGEVTLAAKQESYDKISCAHSDPSAFILIWNWNAFWQRWDREM